MTRELTLLLAAETRGEATGRALFYLAAPMPFALTFVLPAIAGWGVPGETGDVGLALAVLLGLVGLCVIVAGFVRRESGRTIAGVVAATLVAVAPLLVCLFGLSIGLRALFP